jgi:hypothetical protein
VAEKLEVLAIWCRVNLMAVYFDNHPVYASTSIIGTVPLYWSCEISFNKKAVAGLPREKSHRRWFAD